MNECKHCLTEDNIVHSGTDAVMLGVVVDVEHICYDCAKGQRVLHAYKTEHYRSEFIEHEPGVWEVLTYALEDTDVLVNNTGTLTYGYEDALYNYDLHLDLYHSTSTEEVMK